ncbi:MAG: MarR family transcriptional regulator [Oscillospiraceae bacterium]|jgi:DNA-binding MarR family transcriptional regulator|nr:MarR family transcriptional regulator [Oscillospiraceae bacterium]
MENKQGIDEDSLKFWGNLVGIVEEIRGLFNDLAAAAGVNSAIAMTVMTIKNIQPITVTGFAQYIGIKQSNASVMLKALELKGVITRTQCKSEKGDERKKFIQLSEKGEKQAAQIGKTLCEAYAKFTSIAGVANIQDITRGSDLFLETIKKYREGQALSQATQSTANPAENIPAQGDTKFEEKV